MQPIKLSSRKRAAQIFTMDIVMAMLIMTMALLSVTFYASGKPAPMRDDIEKLENLMSEGIPFDWSGSDVLIVGFLTDDRFDEDKINWFASQSEDEQKRLLGVRSEVTIRFYQNGQEMLLCNTCGTQPANFDELVPINRWGVLNGNVTEMQLRLYR